MHLVKRFRTTFDVFNRGHFVIVLTGVYNHPLDMTGNRTGLWSKLKRALAMSKYVAPSSESSNWHPMIY